MAKKTITKKPVTKVSEKATKKVVKQPSVEEEIDNEGNISREINKLEQQAKAEEANTERMEKEIEELDHKVSEELAEPEEKLDEPSNKPPSKKWMWIAVTVVIILVLLAAGYFFFFKNIEEPTQQANFVQREDGFWYTQIGNLGTMPFYHHPDEVKDIPVDNKAVALVTFLSNYRGDLVLTLDPELKSSQVLGAVEISKITSQILAIPTSSAVWKDQEGFEKVTCSSAENARIVMKFGLGSTNRISSLGNCIQVVAVTEEDFTRLGDAFSYRLLGIL